MRNFNSISHKTRIAFICLFAFGLLINCNDDDDSGIIVYSETKNDTKGNVLISPSIVNPTTVGEASYTPLALSELNSSDFVLKIVSQNDSEIPLYNLTSERDINNNALNYKMDKAPLSYSLSEGKYSVYIYNLNALYSTFGTLSSGILQSSGYLGTSDFTVENGGNITVPVAIKLNDAGIHFKLATSDNNPETAVLLIKDESGKLLSTLTYAELKESGKTLYFPEEGYVMETYESSEGFPDDNPGILGVGVIEQ